MDEKFPEGEVGQLLRAMRELCGPNDRVAVMVTKDESGGFWRVEVMSIPASGRSARCFRGEGAGWDAACDAAAAEMRRAARALREAAEAAIVRLEACGIVGARS